jgi:crossover junction endodeoxyribonuclease RuvC
VSGTIRIIGLDPGLRHTGWGVVDVDGNRLRYVAHGRVSSDPTLSLAARLAELFEGLNGIIGRYRPDAAAVEETFVNKNPSSTLKLGQARGAVLLAAATSGLAVAEYPPNLIKKSVVGSGHAQKQQVAMMVRTLLPGAGEVGEDAADALATAICHAHHHQTSSRIAAGAREARQ